MKTNIILLWILTAYFFTLAAVYTVWSIIDKGQVEWAGTLAIGLSGALTVFIGFYLQVQLKNQGGLLPEDRLDAEIDDGDPEIGFYSPWSWWPIVLAAGAAVAFMGLAVGYWVSLYAVPFVLIGIVGWTYEYYRGYFAR
ncbi:MAG: cytochrome c oxidase subunit 4 [Pontimonas sp.]|nr:cytochrome c oxidase subunit 4 [Pontimonas sp.]